MAGKGSPGMAGERAPGAALLTAPAEGVRRLSRQTAPPGPGPEVGDKEDQREDLIVKVELTPQDCRLLTPFRLDPDQEYEAALLSVTLYNSKVRVPEPSRTFAYRFGGKDHELLVRPGWYRHPQHLMQEIQNRLIFAGHAGQPGAPCFCSSALVGGQIEVSELRPELFRIRWEQSSVMNAVRLGPEDPVIQEGPHSRITQPTWFWALTRHTVTYGFVEGGGSFSFHVNRSRGPTHVQPPGGVDYKMVRRGLSGPIRSLEVDIADGLSDISSHERVLGDDLRALVRFYFRVSQQ